VPATNCYSSGLSSVSIKFHSDNRDKDALTWKWMRGTVGLTQDDFGDPLTGNTHYALCVYDQEGGTAALKRGATITAGGACGLRACWKDAATIGWSYKNQVGNSDGITKLALVGGAAPSIQLKAKGASLALPLPVSDSEFFAQDTAVLVQLYSSAGTCWSSSFDSSSTRSNSMSGFKAKTP